MSAVGALISASPKFPFIFCLESRRVWWFLHAIRAVLTRVVVFSCRVGCSIFPISHTPSCLLFFRLWVVRWAFRSICYLRLLPAVCWVFRLIIRAIEFCCQICLCVGFSWFFSSFRAIFDSSQCSHSDRQLWTAATLFFIRICFSAAELISSVARCHSLVLLASIDLIVFKPHITWVGGSVGRLAILAHFNFAFQRELWAEVVRHLAVNLILWSSMLRFLYGIARSGLAVAAFMPQDRAVCPTI